MNFIQAAASGKSRLTFKGPIDGQEHNAQRALLSFDVPSLALNTFQATLAPSVNVFSVAP